MGMRNVTGSSSPKRRPRRGFTLLELMIVLIILVGLMAIAGPRFLGSQQKADIRTTEAQIGNLSAALKMYVVDMKTFPTTEEGLKSLIERPEDERLARRWSGPYIDGNRLPLDPWGGEYQYEFESAGTESEGSDSGASGQVANFPRIFSLGPDGQAGTADDISNYAADGQEEEKEASRPQT